MVQYTREEYMKRVEGGGCMIGLVGGVLMIALMIAFTSAVDFNKRKKISSKHISKPNTHLIKSDKKDDGVNINQYDGVINVYNSKGGTVILKKEIKEKND